ncbi:N-carbamoyl-L-amino-acid hydrolase [Pseudomonas flavescens]|uniref:N-carbamoyl-L-amino-acid hydrolase n=1 Tax=Phytopseudomonas flavescens TaxID=29435 RepID=A0A1G8APJ6_9GAMM|nr:Zn-dependent hydrolase [Pseudomonas flavescens]SDH22774.1 N-carbamoyl-L-amino-acid hydrolase [Pseudomonas flavescens]
MTLTLSPDRLWQSLMQLAEIGATPKGGVCRLALSDLDRQGRDLFVSWCREAGLSVRVDAIGNVFARREGTDPTRRAIAMGSHIDTQPTGGKFDGNYGVLAGLEVLRTLNDAQISTAAPLEVVAWTNEEGSRFVPVMMGSGVFCGAFSLEDVLPNQDVDGLRVGEELARIGYAGPCRPGEVPGGPFDAYFEVHIEQGPVLEAHDVPIGIVPGALGQRWYDVTVNGMEAHAGPTPMAQRHDALLAASRLITRINQLALDHAPHARSTVGFMQVSPNSRNTIAGSVKFSVDLRALDDAVLSLLDRQLRAACAELETADPQLGISVEQVVYFPPCHFDAECVGLVRAAAEDLGLPHMDVVSGAGHDAVYLARVTRAAMIFVPCENGISHNEIEYATPEHLSAGANVLLKAVLARAC